MTELKIHCNSDFRGFKEGEEFTMHLKKGVNFIVGPNGCGKSALLHYIRAQKDDLKNEIMKALDGMQKNDDMLLKGTKYFTIEGLEKFDYIFSLDSIDDDPTNFTNAATAFGLVEGGGLGSLTKSKGEKARRMMSMFLFRMARKLGITVEDLEKKRYLNDKEVFIMLDEVDEGMDLKTQVTFYNVLKNIALAHNATIVCVCHNIMCVYGGPLGSDELVFDMTDRKEKTVSTYIKEQTGLNVTITKEDNEISDSN